MAESLFIKADEVSEVLGISRSEAYRIIKKLNGELAAKGYIAPVVFFVQAKFAIKRIKYCK